MNYDRSMQDNARYIPIPAYAGESLEDETPQPGPEDDEDDLEEEEWEDNEEFPPDPQETG